jgi:diacylglycerol kinase
MATEQITDSDRSEHKHGLAASFGFAFSGLRYFFQTQRNARIELLAAILSCALGAWLRISRTDWAILLLTIALVLILEGINTALEAAIDLSTPEKHPLAKACKDVAAGMVLLAALASLAIGVLILGVPLWNRLVKSPFLPL